MLIMAETLGKWLECKYLEWQNKVGLKSLVEFADYLGIKQPTLSEYMRNKYIPKGQNLEKIASVLGYEAYEIVGLPRPALPEKPLMKVHPDIQFLADEWPNLTDEQRQCFYYTRLNL